MNHNRNYQRIDNAIVAAYKELLKEKGAPDASITELCQKAKVNRTTFYKHYRGIYEITDSVESQLIYSLFNLNKGDKLGVESFLLNPRPILNVLNNNLMKDLTYYKSVFRPERMSDIINKSATLLLDDFKCLFPKYANKKEVMKKVRINLMNLVGSFANLYLQWLSGHLDCELEDITEYISLAVPTVYKEAKIPE